MTYLFEPPPIFDLPLVRGQDLIVDFRNRTPGSDPAEYEPYAGDITVALVIDADPQVVADAVIDADHAVCTVESDVTDTLKKGLLWRCRVSLADGVDLVAMNGVTARHDGKPV